ncbi:hypothetical protein [Glutamicibacter sp. NPDC087344]|uniref:hypothetical protein n=1 Tax=Glutamicibacter sp. NPDC087344 TaxID=3363994 RepID=UPI00381DABF7
MSLNNSEFDDVRGDNDADEPMDGRDSQPAAGSSDAPQTLDAEDPLRGPDRVLHVNDADPLGLDPQALRPEPLDEDRGIDEEDETADSGIDDERQVNLPDNRQSPDAP